MTGTYWNKNGKYEAVANAIEKLVPTEGEAKNPNVEAFRLVVNAYYDCKNNGGGNARIKELDDKLILTTRKGKGILNALLKTDYAYYDDYFNLPNARCTRDIEDVDIAEGAALLEKLLDAVIEEKFANLI